MAEPTGNGSGGDSGKKTQKRNEASRFKRRFKSAAKCFLVFAVLWSVYFVCAQVSVFVCDRNATRSADTGLMPGAEARDLGDPESPNAALFVHGFVGAGDNFADLPDRLAQAGWRVRVMRLPGCGTSPRDCAKTGADELVEAVRAEAELLRTQHDKLVLVGHSMGGTLSTLATAADGADALVLCAPYFGVTYKWYYGLKLETWTKLAGPLLPWLYKGKLFLQVNRKEGKDEITSYTWVPIKSILTLQELGRRANESDVLDKIGCPVLAIHSTGDVAASYEATSSAVEKMGSAEKETVWLERSNHHILVDFEREMVKDKVMEFIDKQKVSI